MENKFPKYQHVERLGHIEVEHLLDNEVYIQPKLDGTNAVVWWNGEKVCFGSRKRELSLHSDNAGFYNAMQHYLEAFENFFRLHSNLILYGEWLVPHSLKAYVPTAWRKLYVFDIYNAVENKYVEPDKLERVLEPLLSAIPLLKVVPVLTSGRFDLEGVKAVAENNRFLIDDQSGAIGEGVVVKSTKFVNRFGRTIWGKMVVEQFYQTKQNLPKQSEMPKELVFVENYLTPEIVQKEFAKMENQLNGEFTTKHIGEFIKNVYYMFVVEYAWEIAQLKQVDFAIINKNVANKCRALLREKQII